MTRAVFTVDERGFAAFTVRGHASEAAYSGRDIVCAAVSSAVYLTANTITDVLGCRADVSVRDGSFTLRMNGKHSREASALIEGLAVHLQALAKQYPKQIQVKCIKTSSISEVRK